MLKRGKIAALRLAEASGAAAALLGSSWRSERLLIIGYHGVALQDEHLWRPALYMDPQVFRRRMELLQECRCNVLPLHEALQRLPSRTLPPRSVVLTVDDGPYDFLRVAYPMIRDAGFPVTVYQTTYYSEFNRPVFDTACSYLLWKARGRTVDLPGLLEAPVLLQNGADRDVAQRILLYARRSGMDAREKDALLGRIAAAAGLDYEAFCHQRLLTLMNRGEIGQLAAEGVDFQLHTHRHRAYRDRNAWIAEIEQNQDCLHSMTGKAATHFCYPVGYHLPAYPEWLRSYGIQSATTCEPGLAAATSNPFLLPRLMDTNTLTEAEFRGWITGIADLLPNRPFQMSDWPLAD